MLPTEDLFIYVYAIVDDAIKTGAIAIPGRPGAGLLRRGDPDDHAGAAVAGPPQRGRVPGRGDPGLVAPVPAPAAPKRVQPAGPLAVGAFEQFQAALAAHLAEDDCQQIGTSALPVKHTSRVRGPDGWTGPNGLHARFGRDAAHAEWFYGFRLAVKTDLGSRIVRAWSIVPAAVNERVVATDLLMAGPPPRDMLGDKGFSGATFAASQAARGTAVLVPPTKDQRKTMSAILQKVIAQWRNRVETTFKEITDQMGLARHGAHTFWSLLARTAATIAAHTLMQVCLAGLDQLT
jgi:Transposase DDE domain